MNLFLKEDAKTHSLLPQRAQRKHELPLPGRKPQFRQSCSTLQYYPV